MATVTRKSTVPYYCAAAVWVLYALFFPLYRLSHFLLLFVASYAVFSVMQSLCGDITVEVEEKPKEEKPTGNEALDTMIRDGKLALAEMKRLDDNIEDEKISAAIVHLEATSEKIFAHVRQNPDKLPQIRRFMDYYLPTTLKLLNSYDRMGAQGVSGENISSTMNRVENMMDTVVAAFDKQLDSLFSAEAMDISTDITVLENMMAREGLTDREMKAEPAADADIGDIKLEL